MSKASKRLFVIGALFIFGAVAAFVSAAGGSVSDSHANQLAGTWVVTIPRPPLAPITVYQTWSSDGTYLSYSGNGTLGDSPAGRSNEFGSWERVQGRLYASSGSFMRFNTQTGALIGTTRIDRTIRLSDDGESLAVVGRVRVLDLDGNAIATALVRTSGERMQIERIPDEP